MEVLHLSYSELLRMTSIEIEWFISRVLKRAKERKNGDK